MSKVPRDVSNGEHWLAGELLTRSRVMCTHRWGLHCCQHAYSLPSPWLTVASDPVLESKGLSEKRCLALLSGCNTQLFFSGLQCLRLSFLTSPVSSPAFPSVLSPPASLFVSFLLPLPKGAFSFSLEGYPSPFSFLYPKSSFFYPLCKSSNLFSEPGSVELKSQ